MFIGALNLLALIVKGVASKARYLQQDCQFVLLPSSENHACFVGASDLFVRLNANACNFFNYVTCALNRSFSSHKACAESVVFVLCGTGRHRVCFILGRPCFLLSGAAMPPVSKICLKAMT